MITIETLNQLYQDLKQRAERENFAPVEYRVVMLPQVVRMIPKLRRKYHIVNALNRTKERSS